MLRSSRAGRKQAARFHALGFGASNAAPGALPIGNAGQSKQAGPSRLNGTATTAESASKATTSRNDRPPGEKTLKKRQSQGAAATSDNLSSASAQSNGREREQQTEVPSAQAPRKLSRPRKSQANAADGRVLRTEESLSDAQAPQSGSVFLLGPRASGSLASEPDLDPSETHSSRERSLDTLDEGDWAAVRAQPRWFYVDEPSPESSAQSRPTDISSPPTTHSPSGSQSNESQSSNEEVDDSTRKSSMSARVSAKSRALRGDATRDEAARARSITTPSPFLLSAGKSSSADFESREGGAFASFAARQADQSGALDSPSDESTSDMSGAGGEDDADSRKPYRRRQPREIPGGNSLIESRQRRAGRKSLKQVEAEESESVSPRRKRSRTQSMASLSTSAGVPARQESSIGQNARPTVDKRAGNSHSLTNGGSTAPHEPSGIFKLFHDSISEDSHTTRRSSKSSVQPSHSSLTRESDDSVGHGDHDANVVEASATNGRITLEQGQGKPSRSRGGTRESLPARSLINNSTASGSTSRQHSVAVSDSSHDSSALSRHRLVPEASPSKAALWKRKAFLKSGLYSDDHKIDVDPIISHGKTKANSQNALTSRKGPLLPLPTDYGYWILVQKSDFRLPFPISQEIDGIREKQSSNRKPPPYKHISTNRYVSRPRLPGEIMVCQCPPDGTCGDSCVNRQTQYLCHPKHCPCGENCTNIQFGKRKPVKTEVKWYGARGFGLRALEDIPKDGFVDEYRGEVISYNEMVWRVRDHYKDKGNYYFLSYDAPAGEMLDGGLKGNITRFANHSCDPNCKIQKWLICGTDEARAGEFQVALFAARDIRAGEELTYDYGWSAFSPKSIAEDGSATAAEPCHCGASNCSGFLGVKKAALLPKATETKTGKGKGKRRKKSSHQPRKAAADEKAAEAALLEAGREARVALAGNDPNAALYDARNDASSVAGPSTAKGVRPLDVSTRKEASSSAMGKATIRKNLSKTPSVSTPPAAESTSTSTVSRAVASTGPSSVVSEVAIIEEPSAPAKKKRITVKDRVTYAWVPAIPPENIDSKNVQIMTGKRQRRPSARSEAARGQETGDESETSDESDDVDAPKRKIVKRRATIGAGERKVPEPATPAPLRIREASGDYSHDIGPLHGLATTADGGTPFDFSKHPPGTKFYTRSGEEFDFARLLNKRRGQRPRVYTLEELRAAQTRHRASVAKANRRRRAVIKANRTI